MSLSTKLFLSLLVSCTSGNLVTLSDRYTADPAPFVYDGRVYIYTSHDLAAQRGWLMTDYSLMSSDDLTNWRDEGIVFDIKNQTWGVYAWAQQVIEGPNGFYMYYPAMHARPGDTRLGVGVAFSSSVTGPFNDVLNGPLLPCGDDPTVFRDDDGQVYFCSNCGGPLCAKLSPNMTSLATKPAHLVPAPPIFFEAPWLSKWQGVYYLSYMCQGNGSEPFSHYGWDICYSSCLGNGCSPLGPYTFRGSMMWNPPHDCGPVNSTCNDPSQGTGQNNHQGHFEFPAGSGNLYFAYHSHTLSVSRDAYVGYQRNVAVDRLFARTDQRTYSLPSNLPWVIDIPTENITTGFIPVTATPSWVRQLKYVDAFTRILATLSSAQSDGLNSEPCSEGGLNLGYTSDGATSSLRGIDFGTGAASIILRVATPLSGNTLSILVDSVLTVQCEIPVTGGWQIWANVSCNIPLAQQPVGIAQNLTLLFSGGGGSGLFNLEWYLFVRAGAITPPSTPPPVTARIALRSASSGLYWLEGPGGSVTPNGARNDSSSVWVIHDLEDGTWALEAASGSFACAPDGLPLIVSNAQAGAPCTRFWLYGTTSGSYGFLSTNGKFITATTQLEPLIATATEPRLALNNGARHWIEEL